MRLSDDNICAYHKKALPLCLKRVKYCYLPPMKLLTANRANKLLYNFLKVNKLSGNVLLPANVCPDVVKTLHHAGLSTTFVDLQVDNLCINQEVVLAEAKEASMLLFVHTYGIEHDFYAFFEQVREQNPDIVIVDDKCLCLPDLDVKDSPADLVLYSTGERKMVNLGGGAIGYLADQWEYDEVRVEESELLSNELWLLDPKQLYMKMDAIIAHKEKLNTIYRALLPEAIQLPDAYQHWRFHILVPNQQEVLAALAAECIPVDSTYPAQDEACVVASNLHMLAIPLYNDKHLTQEQATRACEIIKECL